MTAGLPAGFRIVLDPTVKQLAPGILFGGSPARVLKLNAAGQLALDQLLTGPVSTPDTATLARRLTDANLARPDPPEPSTVDITIVIPVRDRQPELDRCLDALGSDHPVVVVDDGSSRPTRGRPGVTVLRRVNGGPAAARNTALRQVDTELVAFLDSDCVPPTGWIAQLAGHFADPLVAAVAPRIVSYGDAPPSALDLGGQPTCVAPLVRVSYVPTAALLVRRAALGGSGFDEALRFGEDVDLIWRLVGAGWRVRYEPSVQVAHSEPHDRRALLRRRFEYGTSAAPLARRHPGKLPPLVLQPAPTLAAVALLAGKPVPALVAFGTGAALLRRRLRAAGVPTDGLLRPSAEAVWHTGLGLGRWAAQYATPGLAAGLLHRRTRLAAAVLTFAPPIADRKSPLWTLADQVAYGAGVWRGCLRERTLAPVLPQVRRNRLVRK